MYRPPLPSTASPGLAGPWTLRSSIVVGTPTSLFCSALPRRWTRSSPSSDFAVHPHHPGEGIDGYADEPFLFEFFAFCVAREEPRDRSPVALNLSSTAFFAVSLAIT